MKHHHFDPALLLRLLAGEEGEGDRELCLQLAHLVSGCRRCQRETLAYFDLASLSELARLEAPWFELTRRREALECRLLLAWFDQLGPAERAAADDDPRLQRPDLVEALLARCRARWSEEPRAALADAELASRLAPRLDREATGYLPEFDQAALVARCRAYLGNVLRILADLPAAERALEEARQAITAARAEPTIRAEVLSLLASLHVDRRRFRAARAVLAEVASLYGGCGAWHELGRTFLKQAKLEQEAGEPAAVLEAVHRAGALVDLNRHPVLGYVVVGIQVNALCELARFEDAAALMPEAIRLCELHAGRLERLRMRWCEGLIAAGLRSPSAAELAFTEVRQAFLAEGIAYDAALVTLDLAALLATESRWREIQPLAAQMVAVFQAQGIEREALAALALLTEATERELAAGVVSEARRRLRAARGR